MPSNNVSDWEKLTNQATALLSFQKAVKNMLVGPKDEKLVPWNLSRVHVPLQPLMFREASNAPHTHRGAALKYVGTDQIEVITPDLDDIHFHGEDSDVQWR